MNVPPVLICGANSKARQTILHSYFYTLRTMCDFKCEGESLTHFEVRWKPFENIICVFAFH